MVRCNQEVKGRERHPCLLLLAEFVLITVLFCWIVEKDITSNGREDLSQCANYMKTSSLWWKNVGYKLYKETEKLDR
ncbi:hypothetical protein LINGRAHAP2_LOCUS24647 [Linum grandiflorum]